MMAYVDTSCLVAVAFDEPGAAQHGQRLKAYERRFSANLLEAEFRAAMKREEVLGQAPRALLSSMSWVLPERPLSEELDRALAHGYLRAQISGM
jgi:uncharacterized protein with PIN domain